MTLGELIAWLEVRDPTTRVPIGFARPCSYRGYYEDLAFEIEENTTIGDMLAAAKTALGATFTGYKGGEYVMDADARVWLVAHYRETGEDIGPVLLAYMTGQLPGPRA